MDLGWSGLQECGENSKFNEKSDSHFKSKRQGLNGSAVLIYFSSSDTSALNYHQDASLHYGKGVSFRILVVDRVQHKSILKKCGKMGLNAAEVNDGVVLPELLEISCSEAIEDYNRQSSEIQKAELSDSAFPVLLRSELNLF